MPFNVAVESDSFNVTMPRESERHGSQPCLFLKASGLEGGFKLLANFNRAVLTGQQTKYGVQFVTWPD